MTSSAIYLRVSTARQAHDGIGIQAQESHCASHIGRMGWQRAATYTDAGVSGRDGLNRRPGLLAAVEWAQKTPESVVVVYSVSRLARSQRLLWTLLDDRGDYGLRISSATESFDTTTPTGKAMVGMLGVFAQLEADMCSERTRDALAELKARGVKLGAKSAFRLLPAETLDTIIGLWNTGNYSAGTLADALNMLRVPSPKGGSFWWPKTVRGILREGGYL